MSKEAVIQLARSHIAEPAGASIEVNCLSPGRVRTDFARALGGDPATLKALAAGRMIERADEPREITCAATFLAPPAATPTPGQTVAVAGSAAIGGGS